MTAVKICGVTRREDAEEAVRLGAWAVGLNFWGQSPRFCAPDLAEELGAALKRRVEVAGVFVDSPLEEVVNTADRSALTIVQLHGSEGPEFAEEVARRTGCKVIKAIRVHDTGDVQAAEAFRTDFHLFDAHRAGTPGGTGESFDWGLLADRRSSVPMLLAGGLNPENVAEAIALVRPFAVDVTSGVESAPGVKGGDRLEAFFAAVPDVTHQGVRPKEKDPA